MPTWHNKRHMRQKSLIPLFWGHPVLLCGTDEFLISMDNVNAMFKVVAKVVAKDGPWLCMCSLV